MAMLIAWGADREQARSRLDGALMETEIAGVANNRDFLLRLLRHPEFAAGAIDTGFIDRHRTALAIPLAAAPFAAVAAASLALLYAAPNADAGADFPSPRDLRGGWRPARGNQYEFLLVD